MSLSKIEIIKGSGGLARRLAGSDHISGLLYYGTKPAGYGTDDVKQVFSVSEAIGHGITEAALPVCYYHVSEFFRINPNGSLYIGIYTEPAGAHDFTDLQDLQAQADGNIRQVGIYSQESFLLADIATLEAIIEGLATIHTPLSAILVTDFTGVTLSAAVDLTASASPKVSYLIGEDVNGIGGALAVSEAKSVSCLGAVLGALSKAAVHESIAWVGKYDLSSSELDVIGFSEGTTFRGVTTTQLNELDTKGYLFLQKHVGINGSYLNGSWTCDLGSSDYATIEVNRAIDKAIRGVRSILLPFLSSPLYVDADSGKLSEDTIQAIQAEANRPIESMAINGELSGAKAFVNPDQDVLSTSLVDIVIELVPVGVGRVIRVNIGFTTKLS